MPANLEKSAVATGMEKVSFIPISKKGNAKECSNYCTIALISHTSKVMFKILQARLQQYVNHEFPDVQAGFRRGRGTRDQIANQRSNCQIIGSLKKQESSRKTSISALRTMPKALTVFSSIQFSRSVMSNSLRPYESQHARPPCPSPSPGVQTHVHRVSDAIQPSNPLSSPSPPVFNLSQHQVFSNGSALCIRWPKYWSLLFLLWLHPFILSGVISPLISCSILGTY